LPLELNLYFGEIPVLFGENRLLFLLADERGNPVKKGLYVSHQSINQDLILRLRSLRNSEPLDFPKKPKSVLTECCSLYGPDTTKKLRKEKQGVVPEIEVFR
jgi:hypothetical protein